MKQLRISPDLALPLDWMSLATVVYGARGSGKTTFGSVAAEEVTKAGQRFCAIDLKGDWYGLKSSADGRSDGIPVVVFGGDHQDVPLDENAGAIIGRLVAGMAQSTIIDLENFSKGKQLKFLAPYLEALYDANREPLLVLADESQRYAPQGRMIDVDAAKCLGATEDLVKLGRKHGLGVVLFTQRGAGLNKEVSELCDLLVAFRTPGPLDQERIRGWLEANLTREQGAAVMARIASLPTGTATFASAHPDLALFATVAVRRRETFDSSATPKVGHKREEPKRLAPVDLVRIREQLAGTIEKAKADDPRELRKRIQELERDLKKATSIPPSKEIREVVKEVPVLDRKAVQRIQGQVERWMLSRSHAIHIELEEMVRGLPESIQLATSDPSVAVLGVPVIPAQLKGRVAQVAPSHQSDAGAERLTPRSRLVPPSRPVPSAAPLSDGNVSGPQQRILDSLAFLESVQVPQASKVQLALLASASPKSSAYANNLGALRTAGLVDYPAGGVVALTDDGRATASCPQARPTTEDLQAQLFSRLPGPQVRILQALIREYPHSIERSELAEVVEASPTSSAYANNLGALRSLGLIEYVGHKRIVARDVLFLEDR